MVQEKEVAPVIADYWERAEFPFQLVPGLGKLNIASSVVKGYGCPGMSVVGAAMAAVETARVDGSISTFILVHGSLACLTIGKFPGHSCWWGGGGGDGGALRLVFQPSK